MVVLKPDAQLSYDELQTYARERLVGFKIPRSMDVIDELPRNPSGKILKRVLRAPYWEGRDRQCTNLQHVVDPAGTGRHQLGAGLPGARVR